MYKNQALYYKRHKEDINRKSKEYYQLHRKEILQSRKEHYILKKRSSVLIEDN